MTLDGLGVSIDGQEPNPHTLNQYLINNGGYAEGDLFIWSSVDTFGLTFITNSLSPDQVIDNFNRGNIVILNVRNGEHWVLMTGYSGSTLYVNDPGFD